MLPAILHHKSLLHNLLSCIILIPMALQVTMLPLLQTPHMLLLLPDMLWITQVFLCAMPLPWLFGPSDVDLIMGSIARNIESTGPFAHTPTHAPVPPHTAMHTGSPATFGLPTICGKPVNLALILGSVPPSNGSPCGPPSGTTGHPFPSAPPPAPSGPSSCPGPPIPSPPGPPISPPGPPGPPTLSGFPTPPPGPPVEVSTGSTPFLNGVDWREHHIDPTKLEDHIVASACTIQPWTFNCPKVGSTINHGVCFKTFACTRNAYMRAIE